MQLTGRAAQLCCWLLLTLNTPLGSCLSLRNTSSNASNGTANGTAANVTTIVITTMLTAATNVGDTQLQVESEAGFQAGMEITIDPGTPNEEASVISGFGSILLQSPLLFPHIAGSTVQAVVSTGPTPPPYRGPTPQTDMQAWALSMEGTLASMQSKLAEKVIMNMPSLKAKKALRESRELYEQGLMHAEKTTEALKETAKLKQQLQRMQDAQARALKAAEKQLNDGLPGYPKLPDGSDFIPPTVAISHVSAGARARGPLANVPLSVPGVTVR